jgi:hypothetical protein
MRRVLLAASALLFCGAIAAREKAEPVLLVFLRVDRSQGIAFLRPVIAPDIGVQVVPGSPELEPGTVLRCEPSTHAQSAVVEGQVASISELVLACGDYKFMVKGLDFSGHAK